MTGGVGGGGGVGPGGGGGEGPGLGLERALHYDGSWYEAIKSKDATLITGLIHIRGALALKSVVALLHHAVFDGNRQIVDIFLQHGCDVNGRDTAYSGVTALMEAVRKEDLGVVALLLDHGARVDLVDSCKDNVFHWAARYTSGTFLRRFLSLVESRGAQGLALALAAAGRGASSSSSSSSSMVVMTPSQLLQCLASAKNGKHLTPSDVAKSDMVRAYLKRYYLLDHQQQQQQQQQHRSISTASTSSTNNSAPPPPPPHANSTGSCTNNSSNQHDNTHQQQHHHHHRRHSSTPQRNSSMTSTLNASTRGGGGGGGGYYY